MSELTETLVRALKVGSANGSKEFLIPQETMEFIVCTLKEYEDKIENYRRIIRSN